MPSKVKVVGSPSPAEPEVAGSIKIELPLVFIVKSASFDQAPDPLTQSTVTEKVEYVPKVGTPAVLAKSLMFRVTGEPLGTFVGPAIAGNEYCAFS